MAFDSLPPFDIIGQSILLLALKGTRPYEAFWTVTKLYKVSAKAVIFYGQEILLARKPNGMWDLPGGHIDIGETPVDAVKREAMEELGITIKVGKVIHSDVRRKTNGPDVCVIAYLCTTKTPMRKIRLSDEHINAKLFPLAKVKHLNIEPTFLQAVKLAAQEFKKMKSQPPRRRKED